MSRTDVVNKGWRRYHCRRCNVSFGSSGWWYLPFVLQRPKFCVLGFVTSIVFVPAMIVINALGAYMVRTHTNTYKRILMGNRRKMALWGNVMRTMQTCGETIRWPRGESALPHKTIVCISFSIAFASFPTGILSDNSGYPTTKVTDASSSTPCWGVMGGLVQ